MTVVLLQVSCNEQKFCTEKEFDVVVDGNRVGHMVLYESDLSTGIAKLDIFEPYRNLGYGSQVVRQTADKYGVVYTAPDNANSQRLLECLGRKCEGREA